jgi:hypothetical protein
VFGHRASRVPRALLVHRKKTWGVVELARAVGISQGYVAKVLSILREAGIVRQGPSGYSLEKPRELLDAWARIRRFGDGDIVQVFTVVADPSSLENKFTTVARKLNASYALTLMSGAGHRAPFVRAQAVYAYLEGDPTPVVRELRGIQVSEGGNLILARPHDEGVFYGVQEVDNVRVVSDVQLYADLFSFGNRGREQADFLLDQCLSDLTYSDAPEARARFLEAIKVRDIADRKLQLEREYEKAAELYRDVVGRLAVLKASGSASELRRAKLLLWMSLAHVAELKLDPIVMEEARSICVTDQEVEELRREVGYNAAHVELALLAYYAALARMATDDSERRRYREKALTHGTIALSSYTESSGEIGNAAHAILARLGQ